MPCVWVRVATLLLASTTDSIRTAPLLFVTVCPPFAAVADGVRVTADNIFCSATCDCFGTSADNFFGTAALPITAADDFCTADADFFHIATLFHAVTDDCVRATTAGDHVCTAALHVTADVGVDTDAQLLVAAGDDCFCTAALLAAAVDDVLHTTTLPLDLSTSSVLGSSVYCTITRLPALLHLALLGRATRARDHVRHLLGEFVLARQSSLRLNCLASFPAVAGVLCAGAAALVATAAVGCCCRAGGGCWLTAGCVPAMRTRHLRHQWPFWPQ
ncbi:hypothetical protein PF007_g27181 [Phytophthora fragariae]|uniref:Uncharacterized protein n=1 Tax=Phytophthora fragariae TaxID=53985 RepID=A0A6A3Q6R6_9STRA|nr:hypothetical protein PF007_g27181 [Phytophthora fragariae]